MAMDNVKSTDRSLIPYSEDGVFKKPTRPGLAKVRNKNLAILDEESYIQNLENIIERDFFPDLPTLKVQVEYLEALEKNDVIKLRELHHKYATRTSSVLSRPGTSLSECNSPCTFETPLHKLTSSQLPTDLEKELADNGNSADVSAAKGKQTSLDGYLAKTTSEDNASFEVIMEEAQKQHHMKYAWLYQDEQKFIEDQDKRLALPPIEKQAIQEERPVQVDTWIYKNRNALMYVPDGVELSDVELQDMKNKQREIMYTGTRYQKAPFNEQANRQAISEAAQIQARQKEGKIGIDGKELLPTDSPTINGYGFVKTPSPMPGVDESPLMTWGEIEGTPFCLDGKNTPAHTPGPTFRIPEVPARDKLALVLANKVRQRHRVKKQAALRAVQENLVSPHRQRSSTSEQLGTMSPAAQRLASSRLGIRTGLDKALLASYSPRPASLTSPRTPQSSIRSDRSDIKSPHTPMSAKRTDDSLTDGLLQIPKRPRAKDFFVPQNNLN